MNGRGDDGADSGRIDSARARRALIAILFVGAALRLIPLGAQSLWFDEVFTFNTSAGSLGHLWSESIRDVVHPPLHYLVEWLVLRVGTSEFVLRLPSTLCGIATIALTYQLAKSSINERGGLLAAALIAISPFQVHLSHEARDFEMLCALALLASWLLLEMEATGGRARWALYGATITAGVFTSYLMAATLAAHALFVLTTRDRRQLGAWMLCALGCSLALGTWLLAMRLGNPQLSRLLSPGKGSVDGATMALLGTLLDFAFGYFHGFNADIARSSATLQMALALGLLFALALVLAGCERWWRERNAFVVLNFALPMALGFYLASTTMFDKSRYFMCAQPFFMILLASGVDQAWRRHWSLATPKLLIVALNLLALSNYLTKPQYQRDDFRGLAHFFETHLLPGDYVVFNASWEDQALAHYFKRPYAHEGIPLGTANPERQRTAAHQQEIERAVRRVTRRWQRVWLVLCYDEVTDRQGLVKKAFDQRATLVEHHEFAGWPQRVRVFLYDSHRRYVPAFAARATGEQACITLGPGCRTHDRFRLPG